MKLNVIKNRFIYLWISWIFIFISILALLFGQLNYWIDMTWWTKAEYLYEKNNLDLNKIKENLQTEAKKLTYNNKEIINAINVFKIAWEKKIWITTWYSQITATSKDLEQLKNNSKLTKDKIESNILADFKNKFRQQTLEILKKEDNKIQETSYTNIWKSFWDYIKNTAYTTLILAIIAIAIYIMYAFSWVASWISIMSFAIITILTLFHDVIIATWLYIITSSFFPEFKIDTFFITALLTILGYSINDTIVVFDRIRSNIKKLIKKKNLEEIIEVSVSETLRRSIFTSLTVIFVLFTIFIFGPETLRGFILAMIFGTIVGTYSSIFIASPLLYEFNKNKKLSEYKEKIIRPEDKIVV